jgi:hypothetical protein
MPFGLESKLNRATLVGMKQSIFFASLVIALVTGCGDKQSSETASDRNANVPMDRESQAEPAAAPQPPTGDVPPPPQPVVSADSAATTGAEPTADLNRLTIALRNWMMNSRSGPPRDFEDFVARSRVKASPPPPGKKYAIRNGWVVLEDK